MDIRPTKLRQTCVTSPWNAEPQRPYLLWQISFITSCRLTYRIDFGSLGEPGFYVRVVYIDSGDPSGTSRVPVLPEANFVIWYLHGACAGNRLLSRSI